MGVALSNRKRIKWKAKNKINTIQARRIGQRHFIIHLM